MSIAFSQSGSATWTGSSGTLSVSTGAANELVLIAINVEGINTGYASTSVSGAGLTWKRRASIQNPARYDTLELWYAFAPTVLSAAAITISSATPQDDWAVVYASFSGVPASIFDPNPSLPASDISGNDSVVISTTTPCLGIAVAGNAFISSATGITGWTAGPWANNGGGVAFSYVNLLYTTFFEPLSNLTVAATSAVSSSTLLVDALSEVEVTPPIVQEIQISVMT